MKAKFETIDKNLVKIEVEVAPEKFEEGLAYSFKKNAKNFNVKGFRPGKAPRKMVEQVYGVGVLYDDALNYVLPGEYYEDYLNTLKYICDNGSDGIKIQLLHVLKGTRLAEDYAKGKFSCLEKDEYIKIVCELLRHIPEDIVIHRLTGDGDKRLTIAPLWSLNKKDVLNSLNKYIKFNNISQGSAL